MRPKRPPRREQGNRACHRTALFLREDSARPIIPVPTGPRPAFKACPGQSISRAPGGLNFEAAAGNVRGKLPYCRDRSVEAVVADIDAAPAAIEQGLAGDDLASRVASTTSTSASPAARHPPFHRDRRSFAWKD